MKKTVTIAYAVIVIALGSSVFAGEIEGVLPGFEVPRASKDQHGNPILKGIGKKTKLPREISHKKTGIEFILIESGEFQMGSITIIGAQPIHTVKITKPFYLGKYEVTNQQYWKAVFEDFPVDKIIRPNSPAEAVSWNYAREFCLDLGGDLPTEAQWEYACRADSDVSYFYCFGHDESKLGDYAWIEDNARKKNENYAHDVGRKKPNEWGLYDMHGNVWEWCSDWYGHYRAHTQTDPEGPVSGSRRVVRGGSYGFGASTCHSASRWQQPPTLGISTIGFRCAVNLPYSDESSAKEPVTIQPYLDSARGVYRISIDELMTEQIFVYDPSTQTAVIPEGQELPRLPSLIPRILLPWNPQGRKIASLGVAARGFAIYKNVIIDFEKLQKEELLRIGTIVLLEEKNKQPQFLAITGHRKVFIDPNFIVFGNDSRKVSPKGPFATIHIMSKMWKGDDLVKLPLVQGFMKRADGKKVMFNTGKESEVKVLLSNLKERSLSLLATDSKANKIEMPIPLPLKGAEENLVVQLVLLNFGTPAKKAN